MKNTFHVNRSHAGKLNQLLWSGIHICSGINKQGYSFGRRHKYGKGRSSYSFKTPHNKLGACNDSSRTSAGYKGLSVSGSKHFKSHGYGRILLLCHGFNRRLPHIYSFCGIYDVNPVRGIFILCKLILKLFLPAHKDYRKVIFFFYRRYRSLNC